MTDDALRGRRVFVTGAGGFVGGRLVARLEQEGASVIATDLDLDVSDPSRVASALAGARPHAVVHLAAVSFVPESLERPEATWRVNYLGARSVLEGSLHLASRPRVLLVGSSTIYGSTEPGAAPFDEGSPLLPASPYAWTKAAADLLGAVYARRGLEVVRARPFNHTGAGRPERFVESSFARQIAEIEAGRRPPEIAVGNLDAVRDFLHVDDVVDAYLRLLDPAVPPGPYNVASGRATPVRALLDGLLAESKASPVIRREHARWRRADALVGSAARLSEATGWRPARSLDETMRELLRDWRQRVAETAC